MAGAQEEPPTTETTETTDTTTPEQSAEVQTAKRSLSCTDGDSDPIVLGLDVKSTIPSKLISGTSEPVAFELAFDVPADLLALADSLGITTINLSGVNSAITVTGGGTGGPYAVSPTGGTVSVNPPDFPVFTAGGTVNITSDSEPIFYSLTSPIPMSIEVPGIITLNLSCVVDEVIVASTGGVVPPPPPPPPPGGGGGTLAVVTDPAYTG